MDLSIQRWERSTPSERETLARRLANDLPAGFSFHAIRIHELGDQKHNVAFYKKGNAEFALIPGGAVSLGYDANRTWKPNPDELKSWHDTAKEYGIAKTIEEYIAEVTLRVRQVDLSPFLIETAAFEIGWESVDANDPDLQGFVGKLKAGNQIEVSRGGATTRLRRSREGLVIAERSLSQTHAELATQLGTTGFRFPTSDEWEYVCSAGATFLFRWGDHVPCDRYPTDVSPAEAAWRKQWVLSAGKVDFPGERVRFGLELSPSPKCFRGAHCVRSIQVRTGGRRWHYTRWRRRMHYLRWCGFFYRLADVGHILLRGTFL